MANGPLYLTAERTGGVLLRLTARQARVDVDGRPEHEPIQVVALAKTEDGEELGAREPSEDRRTDRKI